MSFLNAIQEFDRRTADLESDTGLSKFQVELSELTKRIVAQVVDTADLRFDELLFVTPAFARTNLTSSDTCEQYVVFSRGQRRATMDGKLPSSRDTEKLFIVDYTSDEGALFTRGVSTCDVTRSATQFTVLDLINLMRCLDKSSVAFSAASFVHSPPPI